MDDISPLIGSHVDERESVAELAAAVAQGEWEEITATLRHGIGDGQLFGSLWATRSADWSYPIDAESLDGVADTMTADKGKAFEWITTGMSL